MEMMSDETMNDWLMVACMLIGVSHADVSLVSLRSFVRLVSLLFSYFLFV